jgi:hypothetical protein
MYLALLRDMLSGSPKVALSLEITHLKYWTDHGHDLIRLGRYGHDNTRLAPVSDVAILLLSKTPMRVTGVSVGDYVIA